jgi:glycosyltransferase involved in cell wall biosynthesis
LVVCLNGCTDNTSNVVQEFARKNPKNYFHVLSSEEGLVTSQRKIIEEFPADIYVFSDADDVISEHSLESLVSTLENDENLSATYARTEPLVQGKKNNLCNKIAYLYDTQEMLTKRHYLHGRLFALRDWFIPTGEEILQRFVPDMIQKKLMLYSLNGSPLLTDDIFLSSYLLNKYGVESIKQVDDALCYSWPTSSFSDWYRVYRRRNIEMEKMYKWFPEFNYLKPYLNRKTDWTRWLHGSLSNKLLWLCFLCMRALFFLRLRLEFFLVFFINHKPLAQWQPARSTKRHINL